VDIEKSFVVKQSIMLDHKTPTCLDTGSNNLILAGCEDSVIRLFDTRVNGTTKAQMKNQYEAHSRYITQVKFNSRVQDVFISSSIDGSVRLWDIRNMDVPLANLKHKSAEKADDFKVFSVEWNGPS
jgi:WD40 repeat protein